MFLETIVATKLQEIEQLKKNFNLSAAEKTIALLPACLGFERKLATARNRPVGLIAEVKKASPSKGLIRADFNPVAIAQTYEAAGADCISVLTDVQYFQGSNEFLQNVRKSVNVPILRKDFTLDYRHIYEARMIGADAILLIAAILTDAQLREFIAIARDLGLDVLLEVHDQSELERALNQEIKLIGINNRNLMTFVTDLRTTEHLIRYIPQGVTVVSESGISSPGEIAELMDMGVQAVLVGETFMRKANIGQAVEALMGPVNADRGGLR